MIIKISVSIAKNDTPTASEASTAEIRFASVGSATNTFKPSRMTPDRAWYAMDCVVENGESAGRALYSAINMSTFGGRKASSIKASISSVEGIKLTSLVNDI